MQKQKMAETVDLVQDSETIHNSIVTDLDALYKTIKDQKDTIEVLTYKIESLQDQLYNSRVQRDYAFDKYRESLGIKIEEPKLKPPSIKIGIKEEPTKKPRKEEIFGGFGSTSIPRTPLQLGFPHNPDCSNTCKN